MCDTSVGIFHRNYGVSAGRGWHGSAAYNGGQGAEAGPDQPRFPEPEVGGTSVSALPAEPDVGGTSVSALPAVERLTKI